MEFLVRTFSRLIAGVTKSGLVGLLHNNGKLLAAPKYVYVRATSDNVFYATKGAKNFLVIANGKEKAID